MKTATEAFYDNRCRIYDFTRPFYLLGRGSLIRKIPLSFLSDAKILEIGCGTGTNLRTLAQRHPHASLTGTDVSAGMLDVARRKTADLPSNITFRQSLPHPDVPNLYDVVLLSYTLGQPGNPRALAKEAKRRLKVGGVLAVVDFGDPVAPADRLFKVAGQSAMKPNLYLTAQEGLVTDHMQIKPGPLGLWTYFEYLGHFMP